ncbi:MAG: FAD-dependent oxidoreductase, partial [Verrucomicrobiaceae bacterium]
MSESIDRTIIVGAGVMGLCTAYYLLKSGREVVILDRGDEQSGNCSMGNAGMVVPSHFTPLAAPGMMAKGLRWMFDRRSPFYVRPRPSLELLRWGWLFHRHSTAHHVRKVSPILRDLNLESRALFAELQAEEDFGLRQRGLLMLCKTAKGLDEEAEIAETAHRLGLKAEVLDAAGAAALDPGITMDIQGAVHFPDDCHMDPAAFMRSLRKRI